MRREPCGGNGGSMASLLLQPLRKSVSLPLGWHGSKKRTACRQRGSFRSLSKMLNSVISVCFLCTGLRPALRKRLRGMPAGLLLKCGK
mmetsp:Transcript_96502/g.245296  ORF Transcript_96502/g.245296 Transcript_96502/m.245296 type:complete len:88 (+) Transcript_96502:1336-1599(+)